MLEDDGEDEVRGPKPSMPPETLKRAWLFKIMLFNISYAGFAPMALRALASPASRSVYGRYGCADLLKSHSMLIFCSRWSHSLHGGMSMLTRRSSSQHHQSQVTKIIHLQQLMHPSQPVRSQCTQRVQAGTRALRSSRRCARSNAEWP